MSGETPLAQRAGGRPAAILHAMSDPAPYHGVRREVLEAARAMHRNGLVVASSGNVSARVPGDAELLAVTTAGKDYETMGIDQVVVVDFDGEPIEGDGLPSTEMLLHVALYRARPDVRAVMHTHSVYASALAVAGLPLPPLIDEMVVLIGDGIQVSEYAFPGTEELGAAVAKALGERNAALIRNHGLVGVGDSPAQALNVCLLAERIAHVYAAARALGEAAPLPAEAVAAEMEILRMRRFAPR